MGVLLARYSKLFKLDEVTPGVSTRMNREQTSLYAASGEFTPFATRTSKSFGSKPYAPPELAGPALDPDLDPRFYYKPKPDPDL